jgi:hypothetical protein
MTTTQTRAIADLTTSPLEIALLAALKQSDAALVEALYLLTRGEEYAGHQRTTIAAAKAAIKEASAYVTTP